MKSISSLIPGGMKQKTTEIARLEAIVASALPASSKDHVSVVGIRDGQLLLLTDSPIWASRLRLCHQQLIHSLMEHGKISISSVQIRQSRRDIPQLEPRPGEKRHLDEKAARLISQTADSVTDPALKQALLHLARNTRPSD